MEVLRNEAMAAVNGALVGCHPNQGFVIENKETAVVWWGISNASILQEMMEGSASASCPIERASLAWPSVWTSGLWRWPRHRKQICNRRIGYGGNGGDGCNDLQ